MMRSHPVLAALAIVTLCAAWPARSAAQGVPAADFPVLSPGGSLTANQMTLTLDRDLNLVGQTVGGSFVEFFLLDAQPPHAIVGQFPRVLTFVNGRFSINLADLGDPALNNEDLPSLQELLESGSLHLYVAARASNFATLIGPGRVVIDLMTPVTPGNAMEDVLDLLDELTGAGALSRKTGKPLGFLLEGSLYAWEHDRPHLAAFALHVFIKQVEVQARRGRIDEADAEDLINGAVLAMERIVEAEGWDN